MINNQQTYANTHRAAEYGTLQTSEYRKHSSSHGGSLARGVSVRVEYLALLFREDCPSRDIWSSYVCSSDVKPSIIRFN